MQLFFIEKMKVRYEILATNRGRQLRMTDGKTEIICALDFGIRITHFSILGMENVFYEQPEDLQDGLFTDEGWRLYGGHRVWNTPDSKTCNYPDNDPVDYEMIPNGVILTQRPEEWRQIKKSVKIIFLTDGRIEVSNRIQYVGLGKIKTSAWGINTLSGGTVETELIPAKTQGREPGTSIALFQNASINDSRLVWEDGKLIAAYCAGKTSMKIGVYTASGKATCKNKGQQFTISFTVEHFGEYPDINSNFEIYIDPSFIEAETLGKVMQLEYGETAEHIEYWSIEKA